MPPLNGNGQAGETGKTYWRSLDDVADTPEFRQFMHHEFPAGAAEVLDTDGRRHFLKIMAASMALAGLGLGGCRRWPEEKIAPYANRPAGRTPGKTVHYASCMAINGIAEGLLVTSVDGRPIKIEGNRRLGRGTSSFAQASVLDMYDPDRSRQVMRKQGPDREATSWAALVAALGPAFRQLRDRQGTGLHILSEASHSPSVQAMKARLMQACPRASWHEYEPLNDDNVRDGTRLAFGSPYRPRYDFSRARTVVALDSDFMLDASDAHKHVADYADRRRTPPETSWPSGAGQRLAYLRGEMSRLYSFESTMSLTGANADERRPVRSDEVGVVAAYIAGKILNVGELQDLPQYADLDPEVRTLLDTVVRDLMAARGQSIVIAGRRQPVEVHMLAHVINYTLGNVGDAANPEMPVCYASDGDAMNLEGLTTLASACDAGQVDTLIILGGNPVYNAPVDLDFAAKLAKVGTSIHLSDYDDETSQACTWHVNRAHYLETWGDERMWDGTLTLGQPLILPLFDGRSTIELLALVAGDDLTEGYDIVRRTFADMGMGDVERRWRRALHDGSMGGTAATLETVRGRREVINAVATSLVAKLDAIDRGSLEVVFTADASVWDGRWANNGWLQELPDPITKITWDNAAIIGPGTAAQHGLKTGDMAQITVGGRSTEAAVFVLPGHAEGSITLPLGYGRSMEGRICTGAGFNFYGLRTSEAIGFAGGASVQKAGGTYVLASTQDHHAIDVESTGGQGIQKRLPTLFREADLTEYAEDPAFAAHRTHVVSRLSLWDDQFANEGANYAWGMAIDLNACIGCNACVVACQAENNIPIVGKDQVVRGREMHWLRIDRYFRFEHAADGHVDPARIRSVAMQPVMCMHCETAPCEQVCPVAATVHDKEGLNVMVYNRCVGTRYCSNNCPYKVRRFNYFDYHRREPHRESPGALLHVKADYYRKPQAGEDPLRQLQMNPDVSIRVRGVMEKCTYCTQRVQAAKIEAKNAWVDLPVDDPGRDPRVPIEDGAIQTACEQACSAGAIVFGDLLDGSSRVTGLHRHDRAYEMLEEINTKPRTRYLAKVRNPAAERQAPAESGAH